MKTRFAPSPTGYLHLGGARTALYNWLYARQHNGVFALRIEDTDTERSTKESEAQIIKSLQYLGLNYDEGPIIQSARLQIYQQYISQLLSQQKAYEKDGAIYFKIPLVSEVTFQDLIVGKVSVPQKELKDFVIRKSNGWPVYHFAVVVDDALMQISHVIRGMDHLSNTAKHVLLFQALGFDLPYFAHIPMILGSDKERLSKRHGALGVDEYEKQGILPEALINFLARLGWGYQDQEIFSTPDLLEKFDLKNVSKSAAVFDLQKLMWLNQEHLRLLDPDNLIKRLNDFFQMDFSNLAKEIKLIKPRCRTLFEIKDQLKCFQEEPLAFDEAGITKHLADKIVFQYLNSLKEALYLIENFNEPEIELTLRTVADNFGIKAGVLIHSSRLALSGSTVGPGIFELMAILGKDKVIARLASFEGKLKNES
ncbi:MAG: glutamate--tRNA ligase [Candidatus Margulisiibacteriota bacterium]